MELRFQFHKLCQIETRKWLLVVGAVAVTHILFQFLLLPYGNALRSLLPNSSDPIYDKSSFPIIQSSTKSVMVRNPLTVDTSSLSKDSMLVKDAGLVGGSGDLKRNREDTVNGFVSDDEELDNPIELAVDNDGFVSDEEDLDNTIEFVVDRNVDDDFPDSNGTSTLQIIKIQESISSSLESITEAERDNEILISNIVSGDTTLPQKELGHANISFKSPPAVAQALALPINVTNLRSSGNSSLGSAILKNSFATSKNVSAKPVKKKMRCDMPPKSITLIHEMNQILVRHRRSSRATRPRWSSQRDREILAARMQIENAPHAVNDQDLYAPLFRNISKFKRSYELMERTLKVYIYKDGKKPIFHLPIMKGLYASEGWFMKLMQGNKHFLVKDPRRAHLFYMPFSSRMLEYTLYVRNSHNRTNLRQYLKDYSEKIAAKYPFWNRTDGADHFLVACHDWAPYETRHHMEHCIKALCNADVTAGFKIGRDISLPETYVRSARNPLRDLGGKPPSQRHILAFYAGSMHGYLRPILLKVASTVSAPRVMRSTAPE
ncbi:probable glycosyltransferase At5g03795 [Ricinus communis]|uniref:probable glycosyltransferase At5g03795 n=1 Tax=Ricinus communis TaxID=3988 RepID=UPI000D697CCB|nr:probable glycosyltransferase At5g03795 [Ricinus communis]|eukprot:XP_025012262.1 probable glycosyltransferase At5g03795 [Ricinus communis]